MTDTPTATAVVVAPQPRGAMRELLPILLGVVSTMVMLGGFLLTIGGWRATVDQTLKELDRRLVKAETTQNQQVPVIAGMQKDLSYLAERARREDERRDRQAH